MLEFSTFYNNTTSPNEFLCEIIVKKEMIMIKLFI